MTVLTRQDRREVNSNDAIGHWLVQVAETGEYRVNVTMIEPVSTGTFEVTIGQETGRRPMNRDVDLKLTLPAGPCKLTARIIEPDQQVLGVDYVTINRQINNNEKESK